MHIFAMLTSLSLFCPRLIYHWPYSRTIYSRFPGNSEISTKSKRNVLFTMVTPSRRNKDVLNIYEGILRCWVIKHTTVYGYCHNNYPSWKGPRLSLRTMSPTLCWKKNLRDSIFFRSAAAVTADLPASESFEDRVHTSVSIGRYLLA